jgi:serine/threonine-protein kinase
MRGMPGAEVAKGTKLDGTYRIEHALGEGASGSVFAAHRLSDGAPVAIKLLHATQARGDEAEKWFVREARALNGLNHPHLIAVLDFGIANGVPYLVMERPKGRTLAEQLARGLLAPEHTLSLGAHILAGLAHAHRQGVIHRDIKPENIFLADEPDGFRAKLLDFGLAKFTDRERWGSEASLTAEGTALGTPIYASPEQLLGDRATKASDVYSTGIVLYEMLTGKPPFDADARFELVRMHVSDPPPRPSDVRPGLVLAPALEALLRRALEKTAADRFLDGDAFEEAFLALPKNAARLAKR